MKKFLAMVVIAASLVACNDGANGETETSDTTTVVTQDIDTMQVITDTTITTDTTNLNNN